LRAVPYPAQIGLSALRLPIAAMDRVLLLLSHHRNRQLVGDLLGESYEVVDGDPGEAGFDLCLVDDRILGERRDWLAARREEAAPVLLPVLRVGGREGPPLARDGWEVVDDSVTVPLPRAELTARVESLLRARRFSLLLQRQRDELDRLHAELSERNEELQALDEQKNQFLGMAAHDLRNPLGVIGSYSTLLLDDDVPLSDEKRRRFLGTIQASSQFMLTLINDLLDISAIESGRLELRTERTDLGPLLRYNISLNETLAAEKEIAIDLEVEEDLPAVPLDAEKFEQVLNNLLSNAVKFSHPGSRIQVRASREGDLITICVADQGQGIPAEEQVKLFRPFGRTSVRSTSGEKSTGLGLAIVKRIVEGHGGHIAVESEVGHGTTFRVCLPAPPP
jgi:signal transduction histidine kinase